MTTKAIQIINIICGIVLSFTLPILATTAHADQITSRALLEDASASLHIEDVARLADQQPERFQPIGPMFNRGYTHSAYWMRLEISPLPEGGVLKLRLRPTFIDQVSLYEKDPNGGWKVRNTGDRFAFASSDRSQNALGFLIEPRTPSTEYFIKVKTSSSLVLYSEALPVTQAHQRDAGLLLFQMLHFSIMLAIAAWALREFVFQREAVVCLFVIYALGSVVHSFLLMGNLAPFEPASQVGLADRLTSISILAQPLLGLLFHTAVFKVYGLRKILLWILHGLITISASLQFVFAAGYPTLAFQVSSKLAVVASVLLCLVAWQLPPGRIPGQFVLRLTYTLLMLSVFVALLPYLGWVPAREWSLQSTLLQGLLATSLMAHILFRRSNNLREHAQRIEQEAAQTKAELRKSAEAASEQVRFIEMLTHEIKTPLGVALMSTGVVQANTAPGAEAGSHLKRVHRALGHINDIVNVTNLSMLSDHQRLEPQLTQCNASQLVYECIESSNAPERVKALVGFDLEILSDSRLLSIIVTNLISNALKYAPANDSIELSLQSDMQDSKSGLRLIVSNAVDSDATPDPDRMFTKYYRAKGAQGKGGAGLGLYLSCNLARLIGARLSCSVKANRVELALWLPA